MSSGATIIHTEPAQKHNNHNLCNSTSIGFTEDLEKAMHEHLRQQSAENTKFVTFDQKMFTPTGTGRFPHVRIFPDNFTVDNEQHEFFDDSIEKL